MESREMTLTVGNNADTLQPKPKKKLNMKRIKSGHLGGHLRELFGEAVEAWKTWNTGEPEPSVVLEPNYEFIGNPGAAERNAKRMPRKLTVSQVCGLLWNCTDILPGEFLGDLEYCGLELKRRTYACAARAIKQAIV
jgi:hypothetical protein